MTLHLSDIETALERGNISDIEDAFRALVGWPHQDTIEGASPSKRSELLTRVSQALKGDDRQMPGDIITILEDGGCHLHGGRYRNGAGAVLSSISLWSKHVRGEA
ncbi:hypothetical protein H9Q09_00740 [Aurantimonas sp. DM33-3]|uniref:hypothetical protein n=1 Tax=Aurantimonas sp. DM33-3 TaxID=2766955 RepID=UPI00165222E8|nr:hypothetical protein [Aurantimonas sp. DM33-3]MBC6714712.1 hypothetical protein [Aurantimonas sp. DM33-3]